MKNYPVINPETGKEDWVSRSCAVVGFIYKVDEKGDFYLLASKRGKGCPDFVGKWNVPCGYLDYDENAMQAVSREIHEEVGLNIPHYMWTLWFVNTSPASEKQTVSFRFVVEYNEDYGNLTNEYCEPEEVEDIQWINFNDFNKIEWAFNQKEVVRQFIFLIKNGKMHEQLMKGEQIIVRYC